MPGAHATPVSECENTSVVGHILLPDDVRDTLADGLAELAGPPGDIDLAMTHYHQVFARLPLATLQQILDFGRHNDTPGALYIRNLPQDAQLPPTPWDGLPSRHKSTFVSEGTLLGLSGLLGEPVGFLTEKNGQVVHDIVPVKEGATTQTNQGSAVFLNFHNDIVHDRTGYYDIANPDFLVLNCLRADRAQAATTFYADARDICRMVGPDAIRVLRSPLFRMNAPGSYVREVAGDEDVLSDPVPMIKGPAGFPEISSAANGVRTLSPVAETALALLQTACRAVAHEFKLRPGHALLINNRKGLHARSRFVGHYDGQDRWLQRTYVRRSQWQIRYRAVPGTRRIH
ncbi:TauD/TfdA family dioxygenase [Streptomyces sp. NPDC050516]|uniref:TauD/TfdA family dioxygenase n=1 Tax=Streptomyces sp. NPDC050516 TaxID=3365621 RepID=UPI0037BC596E